MAIEAWKCGECGWLGTESEILTAPNPFDPEDTLSGCPQCGSVNEFIATCGYHGCEKGVSNGTPLADGRYVNRCWEHRPEAVGEEVRK